jgi:hypothetical protein
METSFWRWIAQIKCVTSHLIHNTAVLQTGFRLQKIFLAGPRATVLPRQHAPVKRNGKARHRKFQPGGQ